MNGAGIHRECDVMAIERWLSVVGFSEYEVSDFGRVRSIDRLRTYIQRSPRGKIYPVTRPYRGVMLRPGTVESGHQIVLLGRGNGFLVHKLVLNAFVGPAPTGTECCHFDDNPANNRLGNLRWDTRLANMADYKRNYGRPINGRMKQPVAV